MAIALPNARVNTDYDEQIALTHSDTGAPFDLTGFTGILQFKIKYGLSTAVVAELTTTSGGLVFGDDPTKGIADVIIAQSALASTYPIGQQLVWDLILEKSSKKYLAAEGTFQVDQGVTTPS